MERSLKILDREIDPNELLLIRERIEPAGDRGRTYISKELCQIWDWRLPNDQLQDIACRDLLRRLEKRGLIQLPPPLRAACRAGYMRVKTASWLFGTKHVAIFRFRQSRSGKVAQEVFGGEQKTMSEQHR